MELKHHGIKGQKWGVRNGPPYPIEDKVLAKGTRLNSVSLNPDTAKELMKKGWKYTYNPNDSWDSKVYKGPFAYYKTRKVLKAYDHQFEVTKDLKMPTKKERVEEFKNLYKSDRRTMAKDLKQIQQMYKKYGMGNSDYYKLNLKKKNMTEDDYKIAYEFFNHAMENVDRFKSSKKYAEIMSQKYDAMVDDNNQGIYNRAHDPIIIFNASESLKEVGQARYVDVNEIINNTLAVGDELAKYGERIKL